MYLMMPRTISMALDLVQIGVDFALKVINWDADTLIRLQLWDIAGKLNAIHFGTCQYCAVYIITRYHIITRYWVQKMCTI